MGIYEESRGLFFFFEGGGYFKSLNITAMIVGNSHEVMKLIKKPAVALQYYFFPNEEKLICDRKYEPKDS